MQQGRAVKNRSVTQKDGKMAKSDEQINRESDRRIATAAKKALPSLGGKSGGVADWAGADPGLIFRLVCNVAAQGGAVRLGYTRDSGAYSVGIYMGGDSKTYYCNEKDGINEQLTDLAEYFEK
jgi:hypothetical protein